MKTQFSKIRRALHRLIYHRPPWSLDFIQRQSITRYLADGRIECGMRCPRCKEVFLLEICNLSGESWSDMPAPFFQWSDERVWTAPSTLETKI